MRNLKQVGNTMVEIVEVEFLNIIESLRVMHNIDTLEEMIECSSFVINDNFYEFRYDKDPVLNMYDLYREYIDEDNHRRYSVENPDNYKITKFEARIDDTFRFDLSLKK